MLLDPPVLTLAQISVDASAPGQRPAATLDDAIAAIRSAEPGWDERDVLAKAEALMPLDVDAARAVLLDNGDWDGGLADLRDPPLPASTRGSSGASRRPAATSTTKAARRFATVIGADRVITIPGAPHSPQRTHPVETVAVLLRALGPA